LSPNRHGTTPAGTDHDIGMMLIELGLGDADGGIEIIVGQGRVQGFVAVAALASLPV